MFIRDFDASILMCSDTRNKLLLLLFDLWLSVSLNESDGSSSFILRCLGIARGADASLLSSLSTVFNVCLNS